MNWITFVRSLFFHPQPVQKYVLRTFSNSVNAENPYLEKYADKLANAKKTLGEDLKPLHLNISKTLVTPSKKKTLKDEVEGKKDASQFQALSLQKQKDLSQIMKLEIVKGKSGDEIASIWMQHHQVKEGVYAVLPGESYERLYSNLTKYPTFLFPLPRSKGFEFIMCQFLANSCYFTTLINYQAHKENAPVLLTVTYYTDFKHDKGIVLMRGEYDANMLNAFEAQCLTNQLQLYYGESNEATFQLVHTFNKNPEQFKHMDLISNFEKGFS